MENNVIRVHKAPKGYIYVHRKNTTFAEVILDTKDYPANIDGFKLVRVPSKEEHAELLKKLGTRR
jgi:hypothetical protein